jgi:hypothetical protein
MKVCNMDNGFTRVGTFFQTAAANNAVVAIVLPTNNLYGIIIRTCTLVINAPAAAAAQGTLVADTVAPSGPGVGRVIAFCDGPANAVISQTIPYQIFVPPGLGLWWAAQAAAAATANSAVLTYDLVQPA